MSPNPEIEKFLHSLHNLHTNSKKERHNLYLHDDVWGACTQFARLLRINPCDLFEKALVEYLNNHQADPDLNAPVTINFGSMMTLPEGLLITYKAEATAYKIALEQSITSLKGAMTAKAPSPFMAKNFNKLRRELSKTQHFLKSAKGFSDCELTNLVLEAAGAFVAYKNYTQNRAQETQRL